MKEEILNIIRTGGPKLPSELSKQLKSNTIFIGAHLSELTQNKKLLISHLKIGSSPLYYLNGQQSRLQHFYRYLNSKEKEAFDILKKEKVLEDKKQQPAIRIALRAIKDFAIPISVNTNGEKKIFWKWSLTTDKEVREILTKKLDNTEEKKKREDLQRQTEKVKLEKEKALEELRKRQEAEKKRSEELQRQIKEEKIKLEKEKLKLKEEKKIIEKSKEEQTRLKEPEKEAKPKKPIEDPFLDQIKDYCSKNNITITDFKIIKKKSDIELTIKVPSAVGDATYFCKARNKKRVSDSDLSSALVKAQMKKLPALFLGTGDLTKKAKTELEEDLKNHIIFKSM